jgi:hypothetical protein
MAFRCDHHDHLEQVGCRVRANDEPAVGVISCVFECQSMIDGVEDVLIGDAGLRGDS